MRRRSGVRTRRHRRLLTARLPRRAPVVRFVAPHSAGPLFFPEARVRFHVLAIAVLACASPLIAQGTDSLPAGVTAAMIGDGQKIYAGPGLCSACHGPQAKGINGLGPNLTDAEWLHSNGTYDAGAQITAGVPASKSRAASPCRPREPRHRAQVRASPPTSGVSAPGQVTAAPGRRMRRHLGPRQPGSRHIPGRGPVRGSAGRHGRQPPGESCRVIRVQFAIRPWIGRRARASSTVLRRARLTFDVTANGLVAARIGPDYSRRQGRQFTLCARVNPAHSPWSPRHRASSNARSTSRPRPRARGRTQRTDRGVRACGRFSRSVLRQPGRGPPHADRDIGLMVDGDAAPPVGRSPSRTGSRSSPGKRAAEAAHGRLAAVPVTGITIGANTSYRLHPPDDRRAASRRRMGRRRRDRDYDGGLHQAGLIGDNWRWRASPQRTRPTWSPSFGSGDRHLSAALAGRWITG
jgi:hypothetical protein